MTWCRWGAVSIPFVAITLNAAIARAEEGVLTLQEAFQLALRYDDRVTLARANVSLADVAESGRWNAIKPTASVSGTAAFQQEIELMGEPRPVQPRFQLQASARLRQPVFRKGVIASHDAGREGHAAADALLDFERDQLEREVTDVYIDVVRARALLALSEVALQRTEALFKYTQARVKAGAVTKPAEQLAQIDVKRAEGRYVSAQREVGRAEAAFRRVVGRVPPELQPLAPPMVPELEAARKSAQRRPDLVALEHRILGANADVDAARGRRWWPQLDIEAGVDYFTPQNFNRNFNWQVLGVISIPLFQAGNENTEIALREIAARRAAVDLERQKKFVRQEVDLAAVDVATTTEGAELAAKQRETATEHYNLIDKQYKMGAITFLEVTTAQAALFEAENAFEIARFERIRAIYAFLYASDKLDLRR